MGKYDKKIYLRPLSRPLFCQWINRKVQRFLIKWQWIFVAIMCMWTLSTYSNKAHADSIYTAVGSVEGELLLNSTWLRDAKGTPRRSQSLSPVWSVRPALDFPINHYVWVGGELAVTWLSEPKRIEWDENQPMAEYKGGRRMVMTPSLRGRLDFPIDCRWVVESLAVFGVTRWAKNEGSHILAADDVRWGLAWRMSAGVRYAINTQVHLFFNLGYNEQVAYGDQGNLIIAGYPLSLGLRGGF
jgi:hypothetical protein